MRSSIANCPVAANRVRATFGETLMQITSSLLPGIRVVASQDAFDSKGFLECSAGIVSALQQYPHLPYWQGSFVPKLPWRDITPNETNLLRGSIDKVCAGGWIQVFRFPEALFERFANIRSVSKGASEPQLNRLRPTADCKAAVQEAATYAATFLYPGTVLGSADVFFNLPNLPTTSNYKDPILLGIHTDTVCNVPIHYRAFSPARLCLNMGLENRYLLFVNLSLNRVDALLHEHGISYEEERHAPALQAFRMAFMAHASDYPVLKLRIKPGEAYIAPLDNIIHDGCSAGQDTFDILFMAQGHFHPNCDALP